MAFSIGCYFVARAVLIPLIKRQDKWIYDREVTSEEREAALEAYPLTEKELEKLAFNERVKIEAAKEAEYDNEIEKQTAVGQVIGKGYAQGFGFKKGGLATRKKKKK